MSSNDQWFARELASHRKQSGMTQEVLARGMRELGHSKFSRSAIAKIETDARWVTVGEAIDLASIVGLSLDRTKFGDGGDDLRVNLLEAREQVSDYLAFIEGIKRELVDKGWNEHHAEKIMITMLAGGNK